MTLCNDQAEISEGENFIDVAIDCEKPEGHDGPHSAIVFDARARKVEVTWWENE